MDEERERERVRSGRLKLPSLCAQLPERVAFVVVTGVPAHGVPVHGIRMGVTGPVFSPGPVFDGTHRSSEFFLEVPDYHSKAEQFWGEYSAGDS